LNPLRLDPDWIVDGIAKPVFASQIGLRRLYADVSEQELDLLQLATTLVAYASAPATKVMRGQVGRVAGRTNPLHIFESNLHAGLPLFGFVTVKSLHAAAHVVTAN
jgi:hypothetical protein